MKLTAEQLREKGFVEMPSGNWIKSQDGEHCLVPPSCVDPPLKLPKRIRQSSKPLMNKLELEWFEICVGAYPEGTKFVPQGVRFKLGNGIWYKPDLVVFGDKVRAYEVKGPFAHRGGFENLKVAAYQYPWIRWSLVWKDKQLHQWQEQEILP